MDQSGGKEIPDKGNFIADITGSPLRQTEGKSNDCVFSGEAQQRSTPR